MGYFLAKFLLAVVQLVNLVYDVITLPIYFLLQKPWRKRRLFREPLGVRISSTKTEVLYGSCRSPESATSSIFAKNNIDTLYKLFDYMDNEPGRMDRPSMGTRTVIRKEKQVDHGTGKAMTKLVLGDYHWITNRQAAKKAGNFGRGLREIGIKPGSNIAIYADTRADWLLAMRGCFQHSMTMVTLYTNLGIEAVKHGINLTSATVVITSQELLPKLGQLLHELPNIQLVVVFEEKWLGELPKSVTELNKDAQCDCKLLAYEAVCEKGMASNVSVSTPKPEDSAVIMFTSGSTGTPKGVIQSHKNLIAAFKNIYIYMEQNFLFRSEEESYVAFLPLAHILEFLAENVLMLLGVKIGYSSPYTLTDTSTMITQDGKGDLTVLKPTMMCAVPLVLDRIYKGIQTKVKAKGDFAYQLFEYGVRYNNAWINRGYSTPILDRLLFKKVRDATGGKLKNIVVGGAPCSEITQKFLRSVLGVGIYQGYGLTETCATTTIATFGDLDVGQVGPPLPLTAIKIRSWDTGNYTIDDPEGPRGEVIVGGDQVAEGYYLLPEQTASDFEVSNGKRWFLTGDIGQVTKKGTIKIIDRKKDLVKLQMGEYVSLGKVESVLKLNPLVENLCVCARSSENITVALVVPSRPNFRSFAESLNKAGFSFEQLAKDQTVIDAVAKSLLDFGLARNLEKFEIPKKITLVLEEWTPDSGLVTAAMKIRRRQMDEKYEEEIEEMYRQYRAGGSLNDSNLSKKSVGGSGGKVNPV